MTAKNFAIGVLSFNHPELTARCVQAAASAGPTDLFLLHNGSQEQHVTKLSTQFTSDQRISHLQLSSNGGFSGGCNFLLNHIFKQGFQWALLLTNDCQLLSLESPPPQAGLYAPLIYRRKESKIDSVGATFRPWTGRLRHLRSEKVANETMAKPIRPVHPTLFYVPGTAFWIDRKTWSKLQGFDESLHTYWEDVDLSLRAQAMGSTIGVHTSTRIIHGVGKTCHKLAFYTHYLFRRNRKTVSRRYSPKWLRPLQSFWL